MKLEVILSQIIKKVSESFERVSLEEDLSYHQHLEKVFLLETRDLDEKNKQRLFDEIFRLGPLENLLNDPTLTEVIVNGPHQISFEKQGVMEEFDDYFLSDFTFKNAFEKIQRLVGVVVNQENPFADGSWGHFRVSIVDQTINQSGYLISFRKHPENPWNFEKLFQVGWATHEGIGALKKLVKDQKNFLVIGPTGCGKTSIMNALLLETGERCRSVIIEDASELKVPNTLSSKLLTRVSPFNQSIPEVNQGELVRRALRLRPDRLIMGEIRSVEAKDFLMAIATGHAGSFASLHAQDPHQALIRLEMLIQMGAPQWTAQAIRQLIQLSLDAIVVLTKTQDGARKLKAVYQLRSLEPQGFLLEQEAL